MEGQELRDLIELISKSNFVTFEIEREGFKLKLAKGAGPFPSTTAVGAQIQAVPTPSEPPSRVSSTTAHEAGPTAVRAPAPVVETTAPGVVDMTSPIVGTFYRQPSQAAPPFVEPGTRVKKGQVLCVIEAMKLMNEIAYSFGVAE